ncbi:CcdC protein domain-containing protein [Paenibacillus sp. Soil787]|uniref:CcdC protein domain-containing protein n=1 Tax=Paenibacillus sp. Soil787 TaxID=1736411 RepID=UPI00070326E1|nr:CcdC protein domain-containing protein [Paenibacillus sp. Soil787]KRF13550.1 hypothetical protein ASG93_13585 [Paenibacillus sp. Soil787]
MQLQNIVFIFLGIFILYRIFLRVRRNIGWQQLNPGKMQVLTAIFFIVGLIFLIEGAFHPISLISDIAGILIGLILAYFGAVMTRFEQRDGRWYFRPNTWMGSLVTAIFFGRLIYRLYEMYTLGNLGGSQGGLTLTDRLATMGYNAESPWTSGLLLVMFAYYILYYIILLRKQKRMPQSSR